MPASKPSEMNGIRILVVEDTLLVAEMIRDELTDLGYRVIGPVPRLEQGLRIAAAEGLDGAFLDVNLDGERSFAIADTLAARGIRFAFLTGYGDGSIPPEYRDAPRLSKPFQMGDLAAMARSFKAAV